LEPDERLAIWIWSVTVSLSGFDSEGLPSVEKLDFVLNEYVPRLDATARYILIERVRLIHSMTRAFNRAKILAAMKK
jgi:hypothetical protein